ncbi:MAG: ferrous iron transport protein A [Bacteroidia bacterium]|nr:ferrous iron transport protein A [Bacteroidia bacterium]
MKHLNRTLDQLAIGESGVIESFTDPVMSLKLVEMGCVPGEPVLMDSVAPLGDPIAVMVCGYKLSLRRTEAASIVLRPLR